MINFEKAKGEAYVHLTGEYVSDISALELLGQLTLLSSAHVASMPGIHLMFVNRKRTISRPGRVS
jgi:hypothetical protein